MQNNKEDYSDDFLDDSDDDEWGLEKPWPTKVLFSCRPPFGDKKNEEKLLSSCCVGLFFFFWWWWWCDCSYRYSGIRNFEKSRED